MTKSKYVALKSFVGHKLKANRGQVIVANDEDAKALVKEGKLDLVGPVTETADDKTVKLKR